MSLSRVPRHNVVRSGSTHMDGRRWSYTTPHMHFGSKFKLILEHLLVLGVRLWTKLGLSRITMVHLHSIRAEMNVYDIRHDAQRRCWCWRVSWLRLVRDRSVVVA